MPLNSTTGFPAVSKVIEKKWEERRMRLHAQKIHDVQPLVKTASPKVYPHMILRLKKIQSEEQKQAEIDKDNQILLQRMTWILKRKGQVDNWNDYRRMSMNKLVREREQHQIAEKNLGIAKKLESVRPYYNVNEWEEEYEKRALIQGQWNKSTKDYESTPRGSMASRRSYETLPPLDKKSDRSQKAKSESTSSSVTKLPKLMGNGSTKYPREYNAPRKGRRRMSSRLSESEEASSNSSKSSSRNSSCSYSPTEKDSSDSDVEELKPKKANNKKANKKKSLIEKERTKQKLKEEERLKKQREEKKKQREEEKRKQKEEEEKRKRKEEEDEKRKQKDEEERKRKERERLKKKQQEEKLKQKKKEEEILKQKQKEKDRVEEGKPKEADRTKQKEIEEKKQKQKGKQTPKQKDEDQENGKQNDDPDDNIRAPSIQNSDASDTEGDADKEDEKDYEEVFDTRRIHSVRKDKRLRSSREDDPRVFSGVMVTEERGGADSNDKVAKDKAAKREETLSDTGGTGHESEFESDVEALEEDLLEEDEEGLDEDTITDQDAKLLFRAVKNLSKPEDVVVKTLIRRSPKQRMLTKEKFEDLYEMSLGTELKKVLGSAHFTLIDCLLGVKTKSDTSDIHNALKAKDIPKLVDLLSSKGSASLAASTTSYKKDYDVSLEQDIRDKISDEDCQNLLVVLLTERPNTETVDEDMAARDAEQLSEAGEGRFSNENGKFILLVKERSPAQLTATLAAYKQLSGGGDVNELLEEDGCSKSFVSAVKALDKSAGMGSSEWADHIHAQLKPNNADLISSMLDRNDQEMTSIRRSYRKKYAGELTDDIVAKCGNAGPLIAHVAARGGVTPAPGVKQPRPPPGEKPKRVNGMRVPSPPKKAPLRGYEPRSPEFGKDNPFQEPQKRPLGEHIRQNAKDKLEKKPPANKGNKTDRDAKKKGSAGSSRSIAPSPANSVHSNSRSNGTSPVNSRPSSNRSKAASPVNSEHSSSRSKGPSPVNSRPSSNRSRSASPVNSEHSSSRSKGPSPVNSRPSSNRSRSASPVNSEHSSSRSKGPSPVNSRPSSNQSKAASPVNSEHSSSRSKGPSPVNSRPSSNRSKGPSPVNSELGELSTPTKAVGKAGKGYTADDDVKKIKEAMKGWGTDEEPLIQIFSGRTNEQRQQIRKKYQEKYKSDLLEDLKAELSGDLEEAVLALMMPPGEYDAYCLHDALTGAGTSEAVLIGILSTRNAKELKSISTHYEQQYDESLVEAIEGDTSGGLGELLGRLMRGERDQSNSVDQQLVEQDAEELYQDGETQIKLDDETFKNVMTRRNRHHARAVFDKYKKLSGRSIDDVIKNSFAGDTEDGYLGLAQAIQSPADFYANRIHSAMAGVGTNDQTLVRILVSRSEVDLADIKVRYKALYKRTLDEAVDDECTGDYKKLLLALIKDKGAEKPKSNPPRKARSQERGDGSRDRRPSPAVSKTSTVSNQSKGKVAASPKLTRKANTKKETTPKKEKPSPAKKPTKNTPQTKSPQKAVAKNAEKAKEKDGKKKQTAVPKEKGLVEEQKGGKIKEVTREEKVEEEKADKKDGEAEDTREKEKEKEEEIQLVARPPTPTTGTITEDPDVDVDNDVTELENALACWNNDEEALIGLLSKRTSKQRSALRTKYEEKHSKELLAVIRSELKGDFEEAVVQMLTSPHELLANSLHDSIESITEDNCLLNVLLALSSRKEIDAVNSKYSEVFKTSFLGDVKEGGAQAAYVNILDDILCGSRDHTYDVDEDGGKQDAATLYNDGKHALKLRDDTFKALLTKANRSQVKVVCDEFQKLAEEDIVEGIKWAMIGDCEDAILGLVRCLRDPVTYFAEHLQDSMAGLGTNDTKLISIIVSRSEIDLQHIKGRYKELYFKDLGAVVSSECSGDYKKILLAVLSGGDTTTNIGEEDQATAGEPTLLGGTPVSPASDIITVDTTIKPSGINDRIASKASHDNNDKGEKISEVNLEEERSTTIGEPDHTKDSQNEGINTEESNIAEGVKDSSAEAEPKSEPTTNDSLASQVDERSVRASLTDEEENTALKNTKEDQVEKAMPAKGPNIKQEGREGQVEDYGEQVSEDTAQNKDTENESLDKGEKDRDDNKGATSNVVEKEELLRLNDKPRPRLREQYSQTELGIIENEISSINAEAYQICMLQDDLLGMILQEDPEKDEGVEKADVGAVASNGGDQEGTETEMADAKNENPELGTAASGTGDGANGSQLQNDLLQMILDEDQEGGATTSQGEVSGLQDDLLQMIVDEDVPKVENTPKGQGPLQDDLLQMIIDEDVPKGENTPKGQGPLQDDLLQMIIDEDVPKGENTPKGQGPLQDDLLQMIIDEDVPKGESTPKGQGPLQDDLLQMIIDEDTPTVETAVQEESPELQNDLLQLILNQESEGESGITKDKEEQAASNILSGIIIDNSPEPTLGEDLLQLILDGNARMGSPVQKGEEGKTRGNDEEKTETAGGITKVASAPKAAGIKDRAASSTSSDAGDAGGELNEDLLQKILNGDYIVETTASKDPTDVSGNDNEDDKTTNAIDASDDKIKSSDTNAETEEVSKSNIEDDVVEPELQDDLILAEPTEEEPLVTKSQGDTNEPLEDREISNLGNVLMDMILDASIAENNGEHSSDGKDEGIEVDAESKEESSEDKDGEITQVDEGKAHTEQTGGNNTSNLGDAENKTKAPSTEGATHVESGSAQAQKKDSVTTDSARPCDPMCSTKQEEMEKKSNTVRTDTVDNINPEMLQKLNLEMRKWQPGTAANADVLEEENGEEGPPEDNVAVGDGNQETKCDKLKADADDCAVGKDECTSTDEEVADDELYGDDWDAELVAVVGKGLEHRDTVTNMLPPEDDMIIINQDTAGVIQKPKNLKVEEISLGGDSGIGNGADDIGNGSGKVGHIGVNASVDRSIVQSLVETIIENSVNEYTSHRNDVNAVGNT